jgi:hypothetical protein
MTVTLLEVSGNMGLFEEYPDYAMMTNEQGERDTKPWVSGQSPLSMGLMSAGLGILAAPDVTSEWVGGGGGGESLGRGGLLGLQAFQQGHQDLQGQRKDFYTHRNAQEDQVIQNMQAKRQHEEHVREKDLRKSMITGLPNLLETLQKTNIPGIQNRIPVLMAQAQSGDVKGAYQSATNLNSQLAKVTKGEPYVLDLGDGQKVVVQKDSAGGYHTGASLAKTSSSPFGGTMKGKSLGIMLQAMQGKNGLTSTSPEVITAYEVLGQPTTKNVFDPETQETRQIQVPGIVPPSITTFMGGKVDTLPPDDSSKPGRLIKKKPLTINETDNMAFAGRMNNSQIRMDSMMSRGYRPSRIVLEYVKSGEPAEKLNKIGMEYFRSKMSADDIIFARNMADWVRAQLREQSGAVISETEASSEVATYFYTPQLSTQYSEEDLSRIYEDFRKGRIQNYQGMVTKAGNAWKGRTTGEKGTDYFYNNSPFQKKVLTKAEKIKARFKK